MLLKHINLTVNDVDVSRLFLEYYLEKSSLIKV